MNRNRGQLSCVEREVVFGWREVGVELPEKQSVEPIHSGFSYGNIKADVRSRLRVAGRGDLR